MMQTIIFSQLKNKNFSHQIFVHGASLCPTLCEPKACCPPGFSVHGILQAGILKGVAKHSSRGSSQFKYQTRISCIAGRFFTTELVGRPANIKKLNCCNVRLTKSIIFQTNMMLARKKHNTVTQLSFKNIYFGLIKHLSNLRLFCSTLTHKEDLRIFPLEGIFVIQIIIHSLKFI